MSTFDLSWLEFWHWRQNTCITMCFKMPCNNKKGYDVSDMSTHYRWLAFLMRSGQAQTLMASNYLVTLAL